MRTIPVSTMSAADNVESRAAGAKKWERLTDPKTVSDAKPNVPDTPLQALMEAAPNTVPLEDRETLQHRREIVAACIELLDPRHRWVINALFSERLSLYTVGRQLAVSKVHVMRIRDAAMAQLQQYLLSHPIIRERLNMTQDWRSAAFAELLELVGNDTPSDLNIGDIRDRAVTNMHAAYEEGVVRHTNRLGEWAFNKLADDYEGQVGKLTTDILDLLCEKQRAYSHGNITRFGMWGIIVRMSDKVERYTNLVTNDLDPSNDESLTDTLIDMVGYAVIARMLIHDTFKYELDTEDAHV